MAISALAIWAAPQKLSLLVQALLTLALVTPFGSLLYRLACESLADASVQVLLTVSVGVHFALTGLASHSACWWRWCWARSRCAGRAIACR